MNTAKAALGSAEIEEYRAAAAALSRGVPVTALRDIRRQRPTTSVAVPLGLLAEWVARGIPAPNATKIVLQLLEHGVSTQKLASLRQAVDDDIASGEPASRALDARAATILSALGPRPLVTPNAGSGTAATLSAQPASGRQPVKH
jgi:hypothetical protein